MRIGELCTLRLDCLSRDPEGDYFLGYHQPKMRKELQIPISRELALVIQEQQHAVRHRWSGSVTWLFPDRKGRPVPPTAYRRAINELAYQHHVRDTTGALFRVHPHGFRHTVGTRMINNDVPQRVVQQFLGHETPAMTARYAHIHDSTMKRKLAEYRDEWRIELGRAEQELQLLFGVVSGPARCENRARLRRWRWIQQVEQHELPQAIPTLAQSWEKPDKAAAVDPFGRPPARQPIADGPRRCGGLHDGHAQQVRRNDGMATIGLAQVGGAGSR
jgi:hypothetical protein